VRTEGRGLDPEPEVLVVAAAAAAAAQQQGLGCRSRLRARLVHGLSPARLRFVAWAARGCMLWAKMVCLVGA